MDVYSGSLNRLRTEVLTFACFEDVRPLRGLSGEVDWYYSGLFSRMFMQNHFSGTLGKTLLIPTEGKLSISKAILIGLGKSETYGEAQLQSAVLTLFHTLKGLKVRQCAIDLESFQGSQHSITALAAFFFTAWPSEECDPPMTLTFVVNHAEAAKALQYKIQNGDFFSLRPGSNICTDFATDRLKQGKND